LIERAVDRHDARAWIATAEIPSTKLLEIAQRVRAAMTPPRPARVLQQVEVMPHEPHGARTQKTIEQVRTDLVVERTIDGFADVMEERRSPEHRVRALASCELEDLERVEERIPFGVMAR